PHAICSFPLPSSVSICFVPLARRVGDGELLTGEGEEEALELVELVEGDADVDGALAIVFADGHLRLQDISQNLLGPAQDGAQPASRLYGGIVWVVNEVLRYEFFGIADGKRGGLVGVLQHDFRRVI